MRGGTAFRVCVSVLAVFCIAGLTRVIAVTGLQVPLDPNEGWNAYHALYAMSGEVLYPGAATLLFNNYPPLSYYIVGALGSLIGDHIVAGRIISLLATLVTGAGIALSARRMKMDITCALFAALLFVAGLLVFTDYVGMDDPQLLGHAVAMMGLVILLNEPRSLDAVAGAALLMTIALFIKHNLVALPVALALWLALYDRRAAIQFVVSGMVLAVLGLAIFHLVYGTSLLDHLNSPRVWSFNLLTAAVTNWLMWAGVAMVGATILFILKRGDKHIIFVALYTFFAILAGFVFAGGTGVDMNVWFDAMIALSLGTALTLDRIAMSDKRRTVAAVVYVLPLAAGIVMNWDDTWLDRDFWLHPMAEEAAMARSDIALLKTHEGPALCEMLSLCYWAGKGTQADVFNLGQAYATHSRSDDTLVRLLDARYYKSIQFDSLDDFALTPRVKQTLLRDYRIDHQNDEGVFLLPR